MNDGELRGIVLEKFYEVRNQQLEFVNPFELSGIELIEPDQVRLFNICEQLGEHGLIHWKPIRGLQSFFGMGKISAVGVDVVEGTARAPITVVLHDHSISISGSSHVQIGDSNVQHVETHINVADLARFVEEFTKHIDELNLDARQKQRAEAQIAVLRAEVSEGEPDIAIVKQAGRSLRNITEGAMGSLLAAAATQPAVWHWIHQMLQAF